MTGPPNTPASTLVRAAAIGRKAGLRYVYAGNMPGALHDLEDTHCHHCGATLVNRVGFRVLLNRISADGRCHSCFTPIPGRW